MADGNENNNQLNTILVTSLVAGGLVFALSNISFAEDANDEFEKPNPPVNEPNDPIAKISFEPDQIFNTGIPIQVNGLQSTAQNGDNIVSYTWEFFKGDKLIATSTGETATFTPNEASPYTIRLIVIDSNNRDGITDVTRSVINTALGSVVDVIKGTSKQKVAESDKINSLLAAIETPLLTSENYRGSGNYVINGSGEVLPNVVPIQNFDNPLLDPIPGLIRFLENGGVFIDYTGYPMFFLRERGIFGNSDNWRLFVQNANIPTLGLGNQPAINPDAKSTFFVPNNINFAYNRSLTLLGGELPPDDVFITSNEIAINDLQNPNIVPFNIPQRIYSMFALIIGQGIYFYSNRFNQFNNYADFIINVHNQTPANIIV
jgi:hypothetical protein